MALKKLPKGMNYEVVRYKHPATPNHEAGSAPVEDAATKEKIEPSDPTQKDVGIAPGTDTKPDHEIPAEPKRQDAPEKHSEADKKPASRPSPKKRAVTEKSVRVRGYVHVPAFGERPDFDELRELYGEKEALSLALSHGMASYEAALRETTSLEPPSHAGRRPNRVETSRSMSHDLYWKAVEHLDPKGMLGRSQIGSRILNAALVYYLK